MSLTDGPDTSRSPTGSPPSGADAMETTTVRGLESTLAAALRLTEKAMEKHPMYDPNQAEDPFEELAKRQGHTTMDSGYVTKDSGQRQEFATGSVRDTTEGKGSFVSFSPHMLRRVAELLERGAKKYGLRNYQRGQPFSRVLDSLMRHTNQAAMGDETEDHKAAIIFNAMAWIHYEEEIKARRLPAELDDLPRYVG